MAVVLPSLIIAKPFSYLSPSPNSKYVKVTDEIILNASEVPSSDFSAAKFISVTGNKSGVHTFDALVKTTGEILLKPYEKFSYDETVIVSIKSFKLSSGNFADAKTYSFTTEKKSLKISPEEVLKSEVNLSDKGTIPQKNSVLSKEYGPLPLDFPQITVLNNSNPSPGYIFMSNFPFAGIDFSPYLMVLDNTGYPVYYKKTTTNTSDFKKQPDGTFTYFDWGTEKYYRMNSSFQIFDSIQCGNGYTTDVHELRILNNGHFLLMSYDPQIVNMRDYVADGDTAATVVGLVVQELDGNKNVVFQWRSWDHFHITDATYENLTLAYIDYVHGNAIEMDNDGNIIISSRHMDEITKINRTTGEIMWRLGGKNNQFTFLHDDDKFSHQHAVRRIANGNITMFDNGNFHSPNYSRAVEYKLDEVNKTAQLVWQYRNSPDVYGNAMGYVQRLANGNTLIGWGSANPSVTEVSPAGVKVFELTLPQGQFSYRAIKSDLDLGIEPGKIPVAYNLYQNYPNPFNPVTNIKFDLPSSGEVEVMVYNSIGQMVYDFGKHSLQAGTYAFAFNGADFSSGVYFYRVQTSTFSATKKMMLVK
jgi:hypothetical protein